MFKNLSILIVLFIVLPQCKNSKITVTKNVDHFERYINAYPTGLLKSKDLVKVHFSSKAIDSSKIGTIADPSIFQISPSLTGTAKWLNEYTLAFEPEKTSIDRTISYVASVNIKSIFRDAPDSLSYFTFQFAYVPIEIKADWDYVYSDEQYQGAMLLEGILKTTDEISIDKIEKSVFVKMENGTSLKPEITKLDNADYQYRVRIHNIQRSDVDTKLIVEWLTDPERPQTKKESGFSIPSTDKFIVTGVKEDPNDPRCLMVYFSDPIDKKQDLRGLITVNKDSVKANIVVEEGAVHVSFNTDEFRTGELIIHDKIKSKAGKNLYTKHIHEFDFEEEKPKVRILSAGSILPYADKVILPFEAINLNQIDVEIFKIFSNNVLYNMHLNDYDDEYSMTKLGRVIHQQTIDLKSMNSADNRTKWISYGLDLTKLIVAEPGAIYEARLVFRPQYSSFRCKTQKPIANPSESNSLSGTNKFHSYWNTYGYYDEEGYSDEESSIEGSNSTKCYESENPCCIAYYRSENFARRTFLASNIAMMVKSSNDNHETHVMVYDVISASPLSSVDVKLYDKQLQVVSNGKTDAKGIVKFRTDEMPRFVVSAHGKNYAYLKIAEEKSLTTSEFDISGTHSQEGIKSFVFMERGVWRPGDTIHFNVILNQESIDLPQIFPLQIEFRNPNNQLVFQQNVSHNVMGLYYLKIPTLPSAVTGNYMLKINYGSTNLFENVKIETVKPNRFKVDWKFDDEDIENASGILTASFLHGAPGSNKKADVRVRIQEQSPVFKGLNKFLFSDPAHSSRDEEEPLVKSITKQDGSMEVKLENIFSKDFNGRVNCTFITEIMDDGGDISTDYITKQFDPHEIYLGLQMPETSYSSYYSGDKLSGIKVICVDKLGKPLSNKKVLVELYIADRTWWYEVRNRSSYYSENETKVLRESKELTTDSRGIATLDLKIEKYNSYYVHVSSDETTHACGSLFYTGWRYYEEEAKEFVQVLSLSTDKEKYGVGETCKIELPGASSGTFVIHVIRNNKIIKTDIVNPSLPKTQYQLAITQDMFPNAYIDVSMIQGIGKKNDLPLRLYGIVPVLVESENLKLKPKIAMKDVVRPEEEFAIEISEERSADMVYQLMIVDDGLLSLTRFKTPDPYSNMFAKEALTLLSWDNYDQFIGNDVSNLAKIFSIGGDQKISEEDIAKMQRFKPVVLVTGPQKLKKGGKNIHKFTINNYIGSVRVMLVGNNYNAFGSAEKNVVVRDELATQITFPRVVSVSDKISVPVTVFKYEDKIASADVEIKVNGPIQLVGKNTQSISFGSLKEKTVWFELKPTGSLGAAKVECNAVSGSFRSKCFIDFYVDNPNPITTQASSIMVDAGASKDLNIPEYGMNGTQNVVLEISRIPKLKTDKYLKDLVHYPYGCVEQTTSSVFPQLYIQDLVNLNSEDLQKRADFISAAIKKLSSYQISNGGMAYWPGYNNVDEYCSAYALHFLNEAKNKGFQMNTDCISRLMKYLANVSSSFSLVKFNSNSYYYNNYNQAYRLYVLANANEPEWGAMNRLRMHNDEFLMAKWLLAGAYAVTGKKDIAREMVKNIQQKIIPYSESGYSYGSEIRDEAIISMVLYDIDRKEEAVNLINSVVEKLNVDSYPTTQELNFTLLAISKIYAKSNISGDGLKVNYEWNGKRESLSTPFASLQNKLTSKPLNQLKIENTSAIPLTINLVQSGKVVSNQKVNKSNGLGLSIIYLREDNKSFDPSQLKQGDKIKARIKVNNQSVKNLKNVALSAVFPSGFEIQNRRIGGLITRQEGVDYFDIRDDRILYYFSLDKNKLIEFNISLAASYAGEFVAPLLNCEAMYEPQINAQLCEGVIKIKSKIN